MLRKAWDVFWRIAVFLLLWAALYAPLLVPFIRLGQLYAELTGAATIFLAVLIMRQPLGFDRHHALRDSAAGLLLGALMMSSCVGITLAAGFARIGAFQPPLATVALLVLANTITQEVLVRGYIQRTIERQFSRVTSIVCSSILFALLHGPALNSPLAALNIFLAGVLLGTAFAVTRNLWLPIAIHFGWNFSEGPLFGLTVSGRGSLAQSRMITLHGPEIFTGGAFGIEAGIVATLVIAIAIYSVRQMAPAAP